MSSELEKDISLFRDLSKSVNGQAKAKLTKVQLDADVKFMQDLLVKMNELAVQIVTMIRGQWNIISMRTPGGAETEKELETDPWLASLYQDLYNVNYVVLEIKTAIVQRQHQYDTQQFEQRCGQFCVIL